MDNTISAQDIQTKWITSQIRLGRIWTNSRFQDFGAIFRRTLWKEVTNNGNLSARYADWLFAMRKGKLVAQGAPGDILTPELMEEVYGLHCMILQDPVSFTPYVVPKGRFHGALAS